MLLKHTLFKTVLLKNSNHLPDGVRKSVVFVFSEVINPSFLHLGQAFLACNKTAGVVHLNQAESSRDTERAQSPKSLTLTL